MRVSGKKVLAPTDKATLEYIRESISYDAQSGCFTWLRQRGHVRAGAPAGHQRKDGYRIIGLCGMEFLAHRVAWLLVTGEWPDTEIDHVNCDPSDNRFENLRQAQRTENQWNTGPTSRSQSGLKGVFWDPDRLKWRAEIKAGDQRYFLGRFDSQEEAFAARCEAAQRLHGEFARAA